MSGPLQKKFGVFVRGIKRKDKTAVVYHPDADGFNSAFIVSEALRRLRGKKPELVFCQNRRHVEITDGTVERLEREKVKYVITVDLCVDQNPKNIRKLENFAKVLVIDHHKVYNDLNSKRTLFIKSSQILKTDSSKYPASKLSFDLFSRLVNLDDLSWSSAVGIIGDNAGLKWRGFIREAARKSGTKVEDLIKIKRIIDGAETMGCTALKLLMREYDEAKSPKLILKSDYLQFADALEKKLDKLVQRAGKKSEFYPEIELMLFRFSDKLNLKSALVNELSRRHNNRTIIVLEDKGKGELGISARRQDFKVKMNELLEGATKGLKGAKGGGHIPAAGGMIKKKDYKKFRKKLIEILQKKANA